MPDTPLVGGQRYASFSNSSNSQGTQVQADVVSAHTKGVWVSLGTATFDAQQLMILFGAATVNQSFLLDIGIGPNTSNVETVISNLMFEGAFWSAGDGGGFTGAMMTIPLNLIRGTADTDEIFVRCQATLDGAVVFVAALVMAQGFLPSQTPQRNATYGAVTSDTGGTEVDPGGTVNTKGSWVELVASTSFDHVFLNLGVGYQNKQSRTQTPSWLADIGIGASGSEVVLIPDIYLFRDSGGDGTSGQGTFTVQNVGPFPVGIPSGTRLSVRAQCNNATVNDREFDAILYGAG